MKRFYWCIYVMITASNLYAQNNLLSGAITGNYPVIGAPTYDFEFVYDGTDLLLVTGSYNTGRLYAFDFNSSNSIGVHDWHTDSVPDIVSTIASSVGSSVLDLSILDMEVNPKTLSVFMLMFNSNTNTSFLIEVKSPSDIAVISLANVKYSSVTYTTNNNYLFDMEWGSDGRFYFCTGDFTLDAEVGEVNVPFEHNTTAMFRATSVFKSNWGGSYFTNAPLEQISFSKVDGIDRLLGVTTCAPGFSIETSGIDSASSVLTVTEDFNVNYSSSLKVVSVTQLDSIGNTTSYLFDLHNESPGNQLIRIGEMYLDGNVVTNNQHNSNAQMIRNTSGNITSGLTDEQAKIMTTGFQMIAKFSEYQLMVADENDVLKLYEIGEPPQVASGHDAEPIKAEPSVHAYFNPVNHELLVQLNANEAKTTYCHIFSMDGRLIDQSVLVNGKIDLQNYRAGCYIVSIYQYDKVLATKKFIIH